MGGGGRGGTPTRGGEIRPRGAPEEHSGAGLAARSLAGRKTQLSRALALFSSAETMVEIIFEVFIILYISNE